MRVAALRIALHLATLIAASALEAVISHWIAGLF